MVSLLDTVIGITQQQRDSELQVETVFRFYAELSEKSESQRTPPDSE